MEDALISPAGFMILSGAGLIEGTATEKIPVHVAETTDEVYVDGETATTAYIITKEALSAKEQADIYVMIMKDGEIISEPFLGSKCETAPESIYKDTSENSKLQKVTAAKAAGKLIQIKAIPDTETSITGNQVYDPKDGVNSFKDGSVVMVDYYTDKGEGAQQIDITPDKFGGNYYLEASTLFRDTNGVDMPAEFIIPNCKIQSNFTFTMASSGDPSSFTFTMDAFPDYTRFNPTKKVLASIQIVGGSSTQTEVFREATPTKQTIEI